MINVNFEMPEDNFDDPRYLGIENPPDAVQYREHWLRPKELERAKDIDAFHAAWGDQEYKENWREIYGEKDPEGEY